MHIASKKYVTLKKEGAQFGIDVQVRMYVAILYVHTVTVFIVNTYPIAT